MKEPFELCSIAYYPVKSIPGIEIDKIDLTIGQGLPQDRKWAVATGTRTVMPDGAWTSCGVFERLTIQPAMAEWTVAGYDTNSPILRGPNGEELTFDINGMPIGSVSEPFPSGIRLEKACSGYWDHADGLISIINLSTLEEIANKIGVSVDPARFRANLYVRAAPWSEFNWLGRKLSIGSTELEVIRPIDRCRATSVRPGSRELDINMPAQLMRHFGHMFCGVYANISKDGEIRKRSNGKVVGAYSPNSLDSAIQQDTAPPIESWPRTAEVVSIVEESDDVRSIWFRDSLSVHGSLDSYKAAKHIRLHALDGSSAWRAYTITAVKDDQFRITVKVGTGTGSKTIHSLRVGDLTTITGPTGFLRLPDKSTRLILLSAGIGITPSVAMLHEISKVDKSRQVHVIHVARTVASAALWPEVNKIIEHFPNGSAQLCTTKEPDNNSEAMLDLNVIAKQAVTSGADVVLCGPDSFLQAAQTAFSNVGLPDSSLVSEAFVSPDVEVNLRTPTQAGPFKVRFKASGIDTDWRSTDGTLLDLAEATGVIAPSHCRAGLCGTCRATIGNGKTINLISNSIDDKSVLLCCSAPTENLEIDL